MFFIYGTDAPIYHYPIVTTAMVVINVFVHFLISVTGYDVTPWILAFGDGFHPLQWLTHNFLHAGWLHLIGNMIFLFPFGLIVEGKIGWLRMLLLYLAIGTFQGFTQQAIMLPSDPHDEAEALVELFNDPDEPMDEEAREELTRQWRKDLMKQGFGSLGASAVIFGLLAVCAIWAPVNEFDVYFRWSPLISAPDGGERQWSVMTVCGIFVVKEFCMFLMMGMPISSEALHLNGFMVGAVFGLGTLYYGLVDCEGFDLISQWTGAPFVSERTRARERREQQQAIDATRPTGPPPAVVPLMAHQRTTEPTPRRPSSLPQPSTKASIPARPSPSAQPSIQPAIQLRVQPIIDSPETDSPLLLDANLPSFDDGASLEDPVEASRREIESLISRTEFTSAVRKLADFRKRHPGQVVSAAAMGKLAEGLIKEKHIRPALTVLSIGCDAYPAYEARWRIRMASLEIVCHQDPIAAIKQLRLIDKDALDSNLRQQYLTIAERASRLADT